MHAAEEPTLPEASAADVKEFGAMIGHCVLCQEPVLEQDLSMEDGLKPLCCKREVTFEEWLPAFQNQKSVFICSRAPSKCTAKYVSKRDDGSLVTSYGIAQEFRAMLYTQPLVMKALQGKIGLEAASVEVVIDKGETANATAEATGDASTEEVPLADKAAPPSAKAAEQLAEEPSDEKAALTGAADGTALQDGTGAAEVEIGAAEVASNDKTDKLETPPEDLPINLEGLPVASSLRPPPLGSQTAVKDEDDGAGVGVPAVAAPQTGADAAQPIMLENVADDAAKAAMQVAPPADALSVVKSWTAQSTKDFTTVEMGAIISKEGIRKEDVLEQCSSGSAPYAVTWAEMQGKVYPSWVPSLSCSGAVLACREDPPVEDRHSPEAQPRMLLSSKVVFPVNDATGKSRTRSADGKYTGDREPLASELLAYPLEDKKSTVVYLELKTADGQTQRVPFAFCLMVDMFAHEDSRKSFQQATDQQAAADDSEDAEMVLRRLLATEPLAVLYCIDGSYVKASPSILKTTNLADDTPASVQMREMIQKSYKEHLARNKGDDIKAKHFGAAEDLGLIVSDPESSACTFNWKVLADVPWADSTCWQKLVDQHNDSMNPSSSTDNAAMLDVSELIYRLTENDEDHERLKEEEKERQEKAARRTLQNNAKSAAESLTRQLHKHTSNIVAALSSSKAGKSLTVKVKNAFGAALQDFPRCEGELKNVQKNLTKTGYDPASVAEVQGSSRPGKRKEPDTWNALVAAFADFKAAVEDAKRPPDMVKEEPPALIASKPGRAPVAPAVTAKELAAKDKTIESKDAALASKDKEISAMKDKLDEAMEEKTKSLQESLQAIIDGAKAQGRAAAQQEELANLRNQTMTFTNDVRLNNVRLGAEGAAAQSMGLLQFASTLHATQKPKNEGDPAAAPFDAMAALRAMQAQPAKPAAPLLGYGGVEAEELWKKEEKKRRKEKKRKRKAKKAERKAKMAKKRAELVQEKGMTYDEASAMIADVAGSESSSDSDSSSS